MTTTAAAYRAPRRHLVVYSVTTHTRTLFVLLTQFKVSICYTVKKKTASSSTELIACGVGFMLT